MAQKTSAAASTPADQDAASHAGTPPTPADAKDEAAKGTAAAAGKTAGSILGGKDPGVGADDQKGKDGQASGEATTPAAAGDLQVKVPDGVEVDKEFLGSFTASLKDELVTKAGMKPEVVSEFGSKMVAMYAERRAAESKAQKDALEKQGSAWAEEFQKDKDFGGQNLAASVKHIERARTMVPEAAPAVALLEEVGLGNHPVVCRFFAALGKAIGEDTTRVAGGSGGGPLSREERLKLRYDKSQPA